jgi:threonine/homoserine/homoserine lactone efflux protein
MVYLAVVAISQGQLPAYAAVAGVALGLAVVGGAAALGLAALLAASPLLFQLLRWGGVAYLLWLAWEGWRDADMAMSMVPERSAARYFGHGLLTNLLNPKAAVFFIAVLPGFVDTGAALMPQTLVLSATYVIVATVLHAVIVTAASHLRPLLEDAVVLHRTRRFLALSLAVVAVWLDWKTRG